VDDSGWCVKYGHRGEPPDEPATLLTYAGTGPKLPAPPPYAVRPPGRIGPASRLQTDGIGRGLVEMWPVPTTRPEAAVLDDPRVPLDHRFCWKCERPVGRNRDKGWCTRCQARFSFVPVLRRGDVVAGKYNVAGCLAHGGQGWIYLAEDRDVAGHWVVLKGVVQPGDARAVATAVAERQFLAQVRHANVVRIYTAVEHAGAGYIVMEYLGGWTLRRIRKDHGRPLPVAVAIAYVLGLLPAFAYLHEQGLVYADFKPDNAMVQDDREIKLIDLGAVKRLDDRESDILGTLGYQAPEVRAPGGLSVASDIFTIARTLAELVLGRSDPHASLKADELAALDGHESLRRFLLKGAAEQPAERFQSADEMAQQLLGVLREVVAAETGRPRPAPSTLFGGDLHARRAGAGPAWHHLPNVAVDRSDAGAGVVDDAAGLDPSSQDAFLAEAVRLGQVPDTAEVRLRRARAQIELGRHEEAERLLVTVRDEDPWDWRVTWYRSLSLLAQGMADEARQCFARVHFDLPGELAPKLAEALATELAGDLAGAARLYEIVSATDPGFTSAAVGLARVREAQGDRRGAVRAYDLVPETSSARLSARVASVRALVRPGLGPDPIIEDLGAAAVLIEALPEDQPRRRAELTAELLESALALLLARPVPSEEAAPLLGRRLDEADLRLGLEQAYRDLARHVTGADADCLIDWANRVRPRTIL
jgi:serine/threonine-protein kinase PknG